MHDHRHPHPRPFGPEHAARYDGGVAAGVVGYHAMLEVVAAATAAALRGRADASLLFVGVGTGQELLPHARFGAPSWRFTGVDPSEHMLSVARGRLAEAGLLERTQLVSGLVSDLPRDARFDGAQMMNVLHHVDGEEARLALLRDVVARLSPGAPFVIGELVGEDPVLAAAEGEFLRAAGAPPETLARRHGGHARLPASDEALFGLLREAGLTEPRRLFASLRFQVFQLRASH